MYQTQRSQRSFWPQKRKDQQKRRRAQNIKQIVKQQGSAKGYELIMNLHKRFLKRSRLMN